MATKHGQIRIIGGLLKRTPVTVTTAVASMRPTPDRVRETLFNWLGRRVEGARCLDLFAGSGALGLEAASRGAGSVMLNELNGRAAKALMQRQAALAQSTDPAVQTLARGLRLTRLDAVAALQSCARHGQQFDLVFLDPPFAESWSARLLPLLGAVLADKALIYLESGQEVAELADPTLTAMRVRHARAGQVHYHLFERFISPSEAVSSESKSIRKPS